MSSVKVEKINPLDLELKDVVVGLDSMIDVLGNRVNCMIPNKKTKKVIKECLVDLSKVRLMMKEELERRISEE